MRELEDSVGLGWRPELAAGIFAHADRIDVLEVIADDHFDDSRAQLRALRTLGGQVPLVLHGVGLGLASTERADPRRLDRLARVVHAVEPCFWSEHLAFVRGGGLEVGHLAAPPRCSATLEGTAANVDAARRIVGSAPLLENVATLLEPPGSDRDEAAWVAGTLAAAGADLLLDLHNLHANATNFGFDPHAFLDAIPVERVSAIHLAGGRLITAAEGPPRVLDDHLHAVPEPVFDLLREVARRASHPLTVVLERDGHYPPIGDLLRELDRARQVLREGRAAPVESAAPVERMAAVERTAALVAARGPAGPRADVPEAALAQLYVDARVRARFLSDPVAVAVELGLGPTQAAAFARIDRAGLALAAESFARKRARPRRA
jgi:uncharacterized protein (UPF0276 family)